MIEKLAEAAAQFRRAIERTDPAKLPIGLRTFPVGACGDATLLLGAHLKSLGFGSFEYVLGRRGEGEDRHSHAWLRQGDILIDITADQFQEIEAPVIVATTSDWHGTFEVEVPHEADFRVYDERTATTLGAAYRVIRESLAVP